jgi:hypothetical protein
MKRLFIIRTYNPTFRMIDYFKKIHTELSKDKDILFIISVHISKNSFIELEKGVNQVKLMNKYLPISHQFAGDKMVLNKNIEKLLNTFWFNIHLYTTESSYQRFNHLIEFEKNVKYCSAWLCHNPYIAQVYEKYKKNYQYIWVMEDDVIYTGNILDFINEQDKENYDYLSSNLVDANSQRYNQWLAKKYISKYNTKLYSRSQEHIVSYSSRFMDHIINMVNQGIDGMSEVTTIHSCQNDGFKSKFIDSKHIGKYWTYDKKVCTDLMNLFKHNFTIENKLYHPCKW